MSTIEQALQQAEQMAVATAAEEQEYQYSTQYLRRAQYTSDNTPIEIVNKEIQSMDSEISVKGESISQYIEFRTDRYQDGVDLLDMLFNVHYEKGTYGGENRPVNVRYNDTKMILGWAVPNAAAKESGTLNMCMWATGKLYDDTYIWKTKPKSYVINDGLTIAENIAQPDDNWYVQFVNELETKIQEFSGRVDDIVQVEESLSTDIQVINEKYDSIMTSAENAEQSAANAQASEQNAKVSEENAYLYKEQTQQIAEQVKEEVTKVYKYQGSVPTYNDLPTENVLNGDVYNVESDGMNYAWDEANQKWDSLGIIIDFSKYSTTEQIELMLNQYVQKESGKGLFSGSYNDLSDKPKIEGTELSGNKTLDELGIASKTALESLSENVAANTENIATNVEGIAGLNNNLNQLEYSDVAGGKNYWSLGNTTATSTGYAWENKPLNLPSGTYTFSAYSDMSYELLLYDASGNKLLSIANTEMNKRWNKTFTISSNIVSASLYVHAGTVKDIQIEEGTTATDYEPYIPSVKMLADEVSAQNDSLDCLAYGENGAKNIYDISKANFVLGAFTSTGGDNSWGDYIKDSQYTEVEPSTLYSVSNSENANFSNGILFYDANKTFLSWNIYVYNGGNFTTPSNAKYIRFALQTKNKPTWIQIEKGNIVSEHKPYIPSVKMLSEDVASLKNDLVARGTKLDNFVDISSYTSDYYECPSDGYVRGVGLGDNSECNIQCASVSTTDFSLIHFTGIQTNSIFVTKGMKIKIYTCTNSTARFFQLYK